LITATVLINGQPIFTRSAVNQGEVKDGKHAYKLDCGRTLLHKREDGAVKLAIAMLKTIVEPRSPHHD
jgi:hypothetical protein